MSATFDPRGKSLPARPGVYLFKDRRGRILYVGKAKSLRARVRGHFNSESTTSAKNRQMLARVADVETIVVASEAEALLLEANLIKAHHPRFNIQLRDDKRYPYVKVTLAEPFPRVLVTRRVENDGARYFGPYTDVGALRHALEVIKRAHTVRSCRYALPTERPARPCLDHHIGRCEAPCVGLQTQAEYGRMIAEVVDVLGGRTGGVRGRVEAEMRESAERLDFERAAERRDVLQGLAAIERRQRALDVRGGDVDALGVARDGERAAAVRLRVRGGKLLGREVDFFENADEVDSGGVLAAAATRFYLGRGEHGVDDLPREILAPEEFEDRAALEEILNERGGRRLRVRVPQRGAKTRLVHLAAQNARHLLEERAVLRPDVGERAEDVLYELQEALDLKVVPRRIVCFDVSHTQGTEVVASAVTFENGAPRKAGYRRFRIRGDWGNDDLRSMAEVVERYMRRRLEEDDTLPDLMLIDGGKGQLRAALKAAVSAGAADVEAVALAKREEEIHRTGGRAPVRLAVRNPALRLLQRARDEAHRFAHGYNRRLRGKRTLRSSLSEVPGIGPARQRALLVQFGSVSAIRAAAEQDIAAIPGISPTLARTLKSHLERSG
ncbi:MAG: excinuclease ABC subunit UvrC [Gemmatimonadota bacterium]